MELSNKKEVYDFSTSLNNEIISGKVSLVDNEVIEINANYKNRSNCDNGCCGRGDCPEHKPNCMEHYPSSPGDWQKVLSDGTVIPIKSYQ